MTWSADKADVELRRVSKMKLELRCAIIDVFDRCVSTARACKCVSHLRSEIGWQAEHFGERSSGGWSLLTKNGRDKMFKSFKEIKEKPFVCISFMIYTTSTP